MPKITDINKLRKISYEIRRDVLKSITEAGSGHTGGSMGLADVFTSLYFNILNHNPNDPKWKNRDRLILSIGHVTPVHYAALAHAGYFPEKELMTLRKLGSRLQGHPGREHGLPGLELSAGSLGQGLSVAVGLSLGAKMNGKSWRTYCILGDGELQEGSVWEAAMSASHHKLDNLMAIVDRNQLQIDGKTSDVMEIEPLEDKWRAFGWEVFHCNGNNHKDFIETTQLAQKVKAKPSVIIARTFMGKGVPSIENNHQWHGKAPSKDELPKFLEEL